MYRIVWIFALWLAACSPQQRLRIEPNRILHRSADVHNAGTGEPIESVRPILLSYGNLMVRYPDGRAEKVSRKNIWGYTDQKGRVYRYYRNAYYEVITMGDVVHYRKEGPQLPRQAPRTYYSKTLDSRVVPNRRKALRDLATL